MPAQPPEDASTGSFAPRWSGARGHRDAMAIVGVLLLTAAALRLFGGPVVFDFTIPWVYESGDGLSHAMIFKSIIQSGGFLWRNEFIGAPFGAEWFDYPLGEYVNFLLVKMLAAFSDDWVVVMDAFVLLGFFLAAVTAFLVLRQMGLQRIWASLGALLFAFLPYHFLRITPLGHLFLAAYWSVPLAIWMALSVWREPPYPGKGSHGVPPRFGLLLGSAVVVGSSGVYYACFACVLVIVAGAVSAIARRSWRRIVLASLLVLTVAVTMGLNVAPSAYYRLTQGTNAEVAVRHPAEAEIYGLKVTQMLLPQPNHRWVPARALAKRYFGSAPLNNENQSSSLGVVGSLGFLVLIGVVFRRLARGRGALTALDQLGVLVLALVLVGTIGGFGSLLAWTLSPAIRAYNRVSILIGFMSLAAVLLILQHAMERWWAERRGKFVVTAVAAIALGFFGLWDQTAPFDGSSAKVFASDREFVQRVERLLPAGAMVYQLPYTPYPENAPVHRMEDYGLLRGYLHSNALRWSYGAMKGREGDTWFRALSSRPIQQQLTVAAETGFGAVYLDRRAYADGGATIEAILVARLGEPIAVSWDGDRAVYRISSSGQATAAQMLASLSAGMDFRQRDFPVYVIGTEGLSGAEAWGRWTDGPVARIRFAHMLPQKFALELGVWAAYAQNSGLPVKVRIGDTEREVTVSATTVRLDFDLRGPTDTIEIKLPAPTSPASRGESADPRLLGIGLKTLRIIART